MVKFWCHLIQSSSPILKEALQTNVNLDAGGKRVWFTFLRRCLSKLGIDHILYTSDTKEITTMPDKLYWHFLPKKRKIPYYTFRKCLVFLPILMLGENPLIRALSYISPLILPQLDNSGTNFLFEPKSQRPKANI